MSKLNLLIKKFNKSLLPIIRLIESFFNWLDSLTNFGKKKKKTLARIDKRFIFITGLFVTLVCTYFLIPTFYDKNLVKNKTISHITNTYDLLIDSEKEPSYRLFPKPHFLLKDVKLKEEIDSKILGNSKNLKIFISANKFFSFKNLEIKDLIFENTEFKMNTSDIKMFKNIYVINKSKNNLKFKNSILFYINKFNDVIFLADIDKLNFSYNIEDDINELVSNFSIYNIPFTLNVKNEKKNKTSQSKIKSNKLRLNLKNNLNYNNENLEGIMNFELFSKSKIFNYVIKKNSLSFNSVDDDFKGELDFKPFYFISDLNFNYLDFNKIFRNDSILLNILNSEILNNQNLNAQLNFNVKKIKGIKNFEIFVFKIFFEEGNILVKNSTLNWNDAVLINLKDIQIYNDKNKLFFSGNVVFDFLNTSKFYNFYQITRSYRKEIKSIELDFLLDPYDKKIELDNVKIDNNSNKSVDKYINKFNSKKDNIFNKFIYRNSIKNFFLNYDEG